MYLLLTKIIVILIGLTPLLLIFLEKKLDFRNSDCIYLGLLLGMSICADICEIPINTFCLTSISFILLFSKKGIDK